MKSQRNSNAKSAGGSHLRYLLTAYLFDSLSEAGRREVEAHLAGCLGCREELAELERTQRLVESALAGEGEPYSFEDRRLQRVLATRPRHPWNRPLVGLGALAAATVLAGALVTVFNVKSSKWQGLGIGGVNHAAAPLAETAVPPASRVASPPRLTVGASGGGGGGGFRRDESALATADRRDWNQENEADGDEVAPHAAAEAYRESRRGVVRIRPAAPPATAPLASKKTESKPKVEDVGRPQVDPASTQSAPEARKRSTRSSANRQRATVAPEETASAEDARVQLKEQKAFGADSPRQERRSQVAGAAPARQDEVFDAETPQSEGEEQAPPVVVGGRVAGLQITPLDKNVKLHNELHDTSRDPAELLLRRNLASKDFNDRALKDSTPIDGPPGLDFKAGIPSADGQAAGEKELLSTLGLPAQTEKQLRGYLFFNAVDPQLASKNLVSQTLEIPPPVVGDEGLGQEGFRGRYGVNPFVDTHRDHLSTFAMDVDTASFTRARGLIRAGRLPEPETVRVEEFVNFFREDHPADPSRAFSVFSEGGPSPFGSGLELLRLTVKAREMRAGERRPAVLTLAIDTSGSMHLEERFEVIKSAVKALLRSAGHPAALSPADRVAIVAYGSQAYLALPHTPVRERDRILGALDSLTAGGSTNVEAGLDLAYRLADEASQPHALNRVILCSDGVATEGERGAAEILKKVKVFAGRGIYLSVIGVGRQRYNDAFLETLADQGNGNYSYVADRADAETVLAANLPSVLEVLARDAKIQVDFNPEVVGRYRLLGYENRDIRDEDFRNDHIDAGEVGPGSTVMALYEIQRKAGGHGSLGEVLIRFHHAATGRVEELNFPLPAGVLATKLTETSDRFRFIACVAELAELLRESYWARDGSYAEIARVLGTLSPEFRQRPGCRDLTELVLEAQTLTFANYVRP